MPKNDQSWQNLASHIRRMLGDGMIDVEITDDQLDDSIEHALDEFRMRSGSSEREGWMFLDLYETQRIYSMPGYVSKVMNIERLGNLFSGSFEGRAIVSTLYDQYLRGGTFDMLTYQLSAMYMEELNIMAATKITYRFHSGLDGSQIGYDALSPDEMNQVPDTRPTGDLNIDGTIGLTNPNKESEFSNQLRATGPILEILQRPGGYSYYGEDEKKEVVLINIAYSRTDAELINDLETKRFITEWAESEAMIILGRAYRKFASIPGPGGGLSLPGNELITEAKEIQEGLKQDLLDFLHGEEPVSFLIG